MRQKYLDYLKKEPGIKQEYLDYLKSGPAMVQSTAEIAKERVLYYRAHTTMPRVAEIWAPPFEQQFRDLSIMAAGMAQQELRNQLGSDEIQVGLDLTL